ncbi:MAG: hypothetical protein KDB21_05670 [Acidimicrobiales bacterium]|nr:hypothetical protein [Acidimicrobiales bacterium]
MSVAAEFPSEIDPLDWPELSYRLGLTDGLPTFPPEQRLVDRLVAGSQRAPDDVICAVPPSGRLATVSAIAANAAMAGCLPDHLPVVVAALEAMAEPGFNLAGLVVTTHPAWPLVIVSGPVVERLGMATGESLFSGGGGRANLAIGRALRLVTWNIGAARPRSPVQEVLGHPGRMSYCIAERRDATPWPPLHERRGLAPESSAVTVFGCDAPQAVIAVGTSMRAELMLEQIADQMRAAGNSNTHTMGEMLVVLAPEWARLLDHQGWGPQRCQEYLYERARRRLGDIRRRADGSAAVGDRDLSPWWPEWIDQDDPDSLVPVTSGPEAIHLMVAGGDSVTFAAVCPGWGIYGGHAVTREVAERSDT